jgi:cytochrome c oxidase subunit 1
MVQSPVPAHNFDEVPIVTHLDEFWHRKYGEDERGRPVRIAETKDVVQPGTATGVHLPSPSYWPLVVALGLPLIAYGVIFNLALSFVGAAVVLAGIYGWGLEPSVDDEAGHDDHGGPDDHGGGDHDHEAVDAATEDTEDANDAKDPEEVTAGG